MIRLLPEIHGSACQAGWRLTCASFLALLMAGCAEMETSDLEKFITDVKSRRPPQIEPLPEIKTFESFYYSAQDLRDPFPQAVSEIAEGQTAVAAASAREVEEAIMVTASALPKLRECPTVPEEVHTPRGVLSEYILRPSL